MSFFYSDKSVFHLACSVKMADIGRVPNVNVSRPEPENLFLKTSADTELKSWKAENTAFNLNTEEMSRKKTDQAF